MQVILRAQLTGSLRVRFASKVVCAGLACLAWPVFSAPCAEPNYRQFDFWLGTWDVYKPDGTLVGRNEIRRDYDGCVIRERYSTPRGYRGESLNSYDPVRGLWHQTWVDNAGTLLHLSGQLEQGSMVLTGQSFANDGKPIAQRIRWTPNADGSVRQTWDQQLESPLWKTVFDGTYRRAAAPEHP